MGKFRRFHYLLPVQQRWQHHVVSGSAFLKKSGDIDITKANGGYTCSFTPAVSPTDTSKTDVNTAAAKTLTYSDGVFTDDVNADIPQIAVKRRLQLKAYVYQRPERHQGDCDNKRNRQRRYLPRL